MTRKISSGVNCRASAEERCAAAILRKLPLVLLTRFSSSRRSYKLPARRTNKVNEHDEAGMEPPIGDADLRVQLELHHEASYGWAVSCCTSSLEDAGDVLQTAYQKILQGRARYKGTSSFKTWLFAVIRNTAAEERRRRWLRHLRLDTYARRREEDSGFASEDDLETSERIVSLRQATSRLPRRQQEVLHLVFYQDLTIEAAARIMGVSLGSARTHYERGKRRLAEWMKTSEHFNEQQRP